MNHTQQPEFWRTIKRILAIVVIIFGFAAGLTGLGQSAREFFGGLCISLCFIIPGAWWLYCEHRDQKEQQEYEQAAANYEQLHEEDKAYLAPLEEPAKINRRWWVIWVAVFALLMTGGPIYSPASTSHDEESSEGSTTRSPSPSPSSSSSASPSPPTPVATKAAGTATPASSA